MKSILLPCLAATAALSLAALGQGGVSPRSEGDLLRTIDSIGSGNAPRSPLTLEGTPLDPKNEKSKVEKKPKGQTEITALEGTFDQKTREAVFIGEVLVKDPEFTVECDRLIALMKKQNEGAEKPGIERSPAANPNAPKTSKEPKGGGLDRATAEANPGRQVRITQDKIEADGSLSKNIGHGRKITYDAKTGDIVLIGMPSVQQGINTVVATADHTVIILNRAGKMNVKGPSKTTVKETASSAP